MNTLMCPVCGAEAQQLFEVNRYWIKECCDCKHRFVTETVSLDHTASIYDDSYFESGGAGYPDYLAEECTLLAHGHHYGKLLQRYMQPGSMLDVGSAAGFIFKGMTDYGWRGIGLEPNDRMAQFACQRYGLEVAVGTLEQFQVSGTYDLVNMIQTIAHFYDVCQALSNAAALTKAGGYWLIETWDKDSLLAKALGRHWHEYSPPSVLRWFSKDSLSAFVARFGFEEVAWGRPHKWITGAHAKSLLAYKYQGQQTQKVINAIPDRLRIPYPSLDLFWALYRKRI